MYEKLASELNALNKTVNKINEKGIKICSAEISVRGIIQVHMFKLDAFLGVAGDVKENLRDCSEIPYELETVVSNIRYFIILDEDEYQEYKNSRATNTTKESADN